MAVNDKLQAASLLQHDDLLFNSGSLNVTQLLMSDQTEPKWASQWASQESSNGEYFCLFIKLIFGSRCYCWLAP